MHHKECPYSHGCSRCFFNSPVVRSGRFSLGVVCLQFGMIVPFGVGFLFPLPRIHITSPHLLSGRLGSSVAACPSVWLNGGQTSVCVDRLSVCGVGRRWSL